jgi:hypothetical protein
MLATRLTAQGYRPWTPLLRCTHARLMSLHSLFSFSCATLAARGPSAAYHLPFTLYPFYLAL